MKPRKLIGAATLCLLLLFGWLSQNLPGFPKVHWGTWAKLAFLIAVCVAMFAAFYDRKNFPEKTWDFNPKRGVQYFFLGWIVFPMLIGVEAFSGADFTLGRMVMGTLALSVLAGILGVFTENIGV